MKRFILALDLGGTLIRTARMDPTGHIYERLEEPTHAQQGREVTLPRVIETLHRIRPEEMSQVAAIGVSVPGPVNPWTGVIARLTNVPGWEGLPLRDILTREFECPVWLGNDANLAALGEHRFGAGRDVSDMVYMTISTGIGGGIISENRLLVGTSGLASELGHMTIEANGPRCVCGNIGCLEVLANGAAVARRARELIAQGRETLIRDLAGGDVNRITAKLVGEAGHRGDPVALEIFRTTGFYVGVGIVNLMHLLNPAKFVLGGGVSKAGELLFGPIKDTVRERAMSSFSEDVPIVPTALRDDVGLLGALALVLANEPNLAPAQA